MDPTRPRDERQIGAILFEAGAVKADQLAEALRVHRETPGLRLGETLVRLGYALEEEVLRARAMQLGIDTIRLQEVTLDLTLLAGLPLRFLQRRRLLPLRREGRRANDRIEVAVTDAVKTEDLEYLADFLSAGGAEPAVRASIEARLASPAEIEAAFRVLTRAIRESREARTPRRLRSGVWQAPRASRLGSDKLRRWGLIAGLFILYAVLSHFAILRYYEHTRGPAEPSTRSLFERLDFFAPDPPEFRPRSSR